MKTVNQWIKYVEKELEKINENPPKLLEDFHIKGFIVDYIDKKYEFIYLHNDEVNLVLVFWCDYDFYLKRCVYIFHIHSCFEKNINYKIMEVDPCFIINVCGEVIKNEK